MQTQPMQPSADNQVGWPMAVPRTGWLGNDLARAQVEYQLSAPQTEALQRVMERCKSAGTPLTSITREQFSDPLLDPVFDRLVQQMQWGPGLVIITGLPVARFSHAELRIIYWGIGTHFGSAVSQGIKGNLMGEVRVHDTGAEGGDRVFYKAGPAPYHSDRIDIISLFSVNKAMTGGESGFKSSYAIFETVAREHPEYLPVLERGFFMNRGEEYPEGEASSTTHPVPVFASCNGLRSCLFSGNSMLKHQEKNFPDRLSKVDREILTYLGRVVDRPEFEFLTLLEPGQMVFINNYEVLHSRKDFDDSPIAEQKRLLLRLWLEGRPRRPMVPDMHVIKNKSGRLGIDPQPHRLTAKA